MPQRLHILIPEASPIVRTGDDLVIEARVVDKGLDDVEHDLGVRQVAFPGAVLAAHGTDADRVSDTVAFMTIGFTVEAEIPAEDRCDVSRIQSLLRGGVIPIQDPLKRLLAELQATMAADGEATIFPEDLDLLVAAIGDKA